MKKLLAPFLIISLLSSSSFAESRADKLLRKLKSKGVESEETLGEVEAAVDVNIDAWDKFKLDDAFLTMLFTEWKINPNLSLVEKRWMVDILSHNFEDAFADLNIIMKGNEESASNVIRMSALYLLYRLDVAQTFFDKWLDVASSPVDSKSKMYITLDQVIGRNAPAWFAAQAITISPEAKEKIEKLDASRSTFASTAKLWTMLRSGSQGLAYLKKLPKGHPFIIPLGTTVVLGLAKEGKVGDAGSLMKKIMEPTVLASGDPRVLSRYYLLLARILYQVKEYSTAIEFYERIPNSVPEFLQARMEMSWALIRMKDMERLRGEIASFETGLFNTAFVPEIYLVRSISNLKYCRFTEIASDFKTFIKSNKDWAKKINRALYKNEFVEKDSYDYHIDQRNLALSNRKEELVFLKDALNRHQLGAVGKNWISDLQEKIKLSVSQKTQEYRRYWKNREYVLDRAILKMRFVKVETLSQVRLANASLEKLAQKGNGDTVSNKLGAREKSDELRFPYDGVIWSDEMFRLRSATEDYCVRNNK